jgi:1-aminocyclopropane-1-carboxylate deaminase/D-cysteine desulfhydrase-like pyridoxal-dependent ACC family enzyme
VARTEGIFLDPIYSGKAMAGLFDHVRRGLLGSKDLVVFLHTGGTPALFAYRDYLVSDELERQIVRQ